MPSNRRIKRSISQGNGVTYRAKPKAISIVLTAIIFFGLGAFGALAYQPTFDFVMEAGDNLPSIMPKIRTKAEPKPAPSSQAPPEMSVLEIDKAADNTKEAEKPKVETEKLVAVIAPAAVTSDAARFDALLNSIAGTEVNAVIVETKNDKGEILYKSKNDLANKWGLIAENAVDLSAINTKLKDKNLSLIVKMSVFKDPKASSKGRGEYAISYENTDMLWLDDAPQNGGKPWLNPYSAKSRAYIEALAIETVDLGAKMVILDNMQFPDHSSRYATFGPDSGSMNRADILKYVVEELEARLDAKSARVAVYFSAIEATTVEGEETRYGGNITRLPTTFAAVDVSPAQFGGDYSQNGLTITSPLSNPAGAVKSTLNYLKVSVNANTTIIPILQGGSEAPFNDSFKYGKDQVNAQINESKNLGYSEYFLTNANGEYMLK